MLEFIEDVDIDIPYASKFVATILGHVLSYENSLPFSVLERVLGHLVDSGTALKILTLALSTCIQLQVEPATPRIHVFSRNKHFWRHMPNLRST